LNARAVSTHPERYFFIRAQRTASTSLTIQIRKLFGEDAVYPSGSDGTLRNVVNIEALLDCWRAESDRIRVVAGHFPYCTIELLGAPFATLTSLRDPVERTLSLLRRRQKANERYRVLSLEELYADPKSFERQVHNHMVKMFGLTAEEMTRTGMLTPIAFTRARLERAKENLAQVDVVGIQEDYAGFCDALTRRFGWNLGEPEHAGRTGDADASDALRTRIADDNALDVELYEYARKLIATRPDSS
jgi:hypothetical protein